MKKVKLMLLSLTLFAVIGGALAFKAKFDQTWCVAKPYQSASSLYCTFVQGSQVIAKACEGSQENLTNAGNVFSCTTNVINCTICPVADYTTINI